MSLLVVQTPDNVLKTSVASEHASKFVCLLKKLVASGYPIKDIGVTIIERFLAQII
jgi:hypothetical protein